MLLPLGVAVAGHELPFYPGYYPQEIRIETVPPGAAAAKLTKSELHAYVGADPLAGRPDPPDLRSVESLGSYLVITFNPAVPALAGREARCESALRISKLLTRAPAGYIPYPYPVTPYHPDYLDHFDLAQAHKRSAEAAAGAVSLRLRARGPLAAKALGRAATGTETQWDATLEDVSIEDLVASSRVATNGWLGPPWLKEGWFHAYLLHAPAIVDRSRRQSADAVYRRLTSGASGDPTATINLERTLVTDLIGGCERVVAGYALRRERFSAEFSQGIENVAADSQSGLNSPVFIRTAKLKDFPWNGWLRLGIATKASAAWNPVAGFSDPFGRLAWAALGDPAMFPATHGGTWTDNRVTVASAAQPASGVAIPEDALLPEPGTGALHEVGKGKMARAKITYRVRASAFHDNTRMTPADLAYAYVFAFRWGARRAQSAPEYDPAVDASTALLRRTLAGFKVVKVESEVKKYSDMTFTYVVPVVEVYLDASAADPQQLAALAPPWSPVPWHVMVLMEEAVKRGFAAFSAEEARRRGVRWLDLARDLRLREALAPVVEGFAREPHVPEALKRFATADEAQTRWAAFKQFVQRRGHLLVTNGPYRLDKWTDGSIVLEVFRDFTNSLGVGSFDRFAIPRRAYVTRIVPRGDRLEIQAEIERVEKFLRDYRIVREPLGKPGADEDRSDIPVCRYVIVSADGSVAASGTSSEAQGNQLVVDLKGRLRPGQYTVMAALVLGDNAVNPEVATAQYRVEAGP